MTWPGMQTLVQQHTMRCQTCQFCKKPKHKYGKLPTKLAVTTLWKTLCVDLIGPHTLKGQDGSALDFMCLTMIDPATSWFVVVELPVVEKPIDEKGKLTINKEIFDKTSRQIAKSVNKSWFCRYPCCQNIIYDNGSEFKLYFEELVQNVRYQAKAYHD